MLAIAILPEVSPQRPTVDCDDPEALGRAVQAEGKWDEAADLYQLALDTCGDDAGLYNSLGQARWQSGEPEKAFVAFKKAVQLNPQNPFMVYNIAYIHTCLHTYVRTYIHTQAHMCVLVYVCMYVRTYNSYIYHIYIHT